MKTTQKISLLAVIALLVIPQIELQAQSKFDPVIAVEPTAMNVLYLGVNNPMNIAVAGLKSSEISVKVSQGVIEGSHGFYAVRPGKTGKLAFSIFHGDKLLGKKVFRVLATPDPVAVLYGPDGAHTFTSGSSRMTIGQLVQVRSVGAELPDFLFDVQFKVISFQMSLEVDGISMILTSDSDQITREMQQQIRNGRPGQVFIFEDINAIGPDGITRKLQPIKVKI